ncbi:MAG: hypothetical protein L6R39_004275 [Caloplaca ligustica]|nr:MAG: hypothetical protein L6R39_004275 [Caloplaca ligustica]
MQSHQRGRTSVQPEDASATSDTSSSDEGEEQVELLVTSRAKRSTAGTRMSSLLENEGDDELELLFAEDEQEQDNEFEDEDAENGSDVQFDSASSDDDQGPTNDDNDLEGEEELQRQARVAKIKKRKAQDAAILKPAVFKKRRVESRSGPPGSTLIPTTPAPRPKKKSERISWMPDIEQGTVRASSRKQTVKNKEIVHSRLVEAEKRRMKQLRVMEEAAKRKEASKPKAMTQAQRMEEAARTERLNAKSLNRWEAAERKRSDEQKAKLEALHNRQLQGPVIRWWSGMARWVNGKLEQVGWRSIKAVEAKAPSHVEAKDDHPRDEVLVESQRQSTRDRDSVMNEAPGPQPRAPTPEPAQSTEDDNAATAQQATCAPPQGLQGFLDGIDFYASLPEQPPRNEIQQGPAISMDDQASPEPPEPVTPPPPVVAEPTVYTVPEIEYSGRTVVILEDIDADAQRLPELQNHVLLKKRKLTQREQQASTVPGSKNGLTVCGFICVQGDTEAGKRRVSLE